MTEERVIRFPVPVFGRIPNFVGAEAAAKRLIELDPFRKAGCIKVNPDAPQRPVRHAVLESGKILYMPTPRLRGGFIQLDRAKISPGKMRIASSIKGAFTLGQPVPLDSIHPIDLIVAGSVAVTEDGGRVGKGEGYSELEYAILRELGPVSEFTPIATTVHDLQIVEEAPHEEHDFALDYIATPTRLIETHRKRSRPKGIIWRLITEEMFEQRPILRDLQKRKPS